MEVEESTINRCLRKPILVYECTSRHIPVNLRQILETFGEDELTQNDHLVLLAYTMIVEAGFIPSHKIEEFGGTLRSPTFDIRFLDAARTLPELCKNNDSVYNINFSLPSIPHYKLCLTAHPSGSIVVFTAWLQDSGTMRCWCIALDSEKYVMKSKTEFMDHKYFNLKELSQKFKEKITLPARSFLKLHGAVDDSCFLDLPVEMKLLICSYLRRHDILNLSKTCISFNNVCSFIRKQDKSQFPFQRSLLCESSSTSLLSSW